MEFYDNDDINSYQNFIEAWRAMSITALLREMTIEIK